MFWGPGRWRWAMADMAVSGLLGKGIYAETGQMSEALAWHRAVAGNSLPGGRKGTCGCPAGEGGEKPQRWREGCGLWVSGCQERGRWAGRVCIGLL